MYTTSLAFPNMINVAGNRVAVKTGNDSVLNRVRLLILTDPTELYNNPDFGVGMRKYLWQYNTSNTVARIQDQIVDQLRKYEPCVVAEDTSFADSLQLNNGSNNGNTYNQINMTVGLKTIYEDTLTISLNND